MPRGGFREGGGRKKLSESGRIAFALSFQQNQIDFIKEQARKAGKSNSAFVWDAVKSCAEKQN